MIFATGMTGMIGRILAERMSGTGATVRALVRDFDKAADLRRLGIETVTGDLANREMLEQAMRGTSDVLMLSSMAQNQVELQGNLIRAAKAVGVPHLVKVSAINAGEDAPLELARLHGQTEREMTDSGIPSTFLRPTFFMQNLLQSADMVKGGQLMGPWGDAAVSFVDVRDIADVIARVLMEEGHEGKTYTLTSGRAYRYTEVASLLGEAVGHPVTYVDVSLDQYHDGMRKAGVEEWDARVLTELFGIARAGQVGGVTGDVERLLGRKPRELQEFARDYADVFRR